MSRFSRKIRNASKKLLYGTIIFSALNLAGSAFISCLDRNLPNPKSYKCNAYSLPYCNKPNSHYGKINVNGDEMHMNDIGLKVRAETFADVVLPYLK